MSILVLEASKRRFRYALVGTLPLIGPRVPKHDWLGLKERHGKDLEASLVGGTLRLGFGIASDDDSGGH